MCGISGILSKHEIASDNIFHSLQKMKHRGPDDTLIFDADSCQFFSTPISNNHSKTHFPEISKHQVSRKWFGFNRLSIVDLTPNGMQPFYDKENDLLFLMNGEIYNYTELKEKHLKHYSFSGKSDAEVGFKMYVEKGDDFVQYLRGMFAIVVYDLKNQIIKVWRDRFGIKPFYYYQDEDKFVFASEINGIVSYNMIAKELNEQALAYSMYLGTSPSPLTLYKHIISLQPGYYLSYHFKTGQKVLKPYWTLQYTPSTHKIDLSDFDQILSDLAELYYADQVKSAISLSGGLDSGILAYYLNKNPRKVTAVHISEPSKSEWNETKLNAENAGVNLLSEIFINESILKDEIYQLEEEPNFILEPTWVVSKFAQKNQCKVLYNALGPDEIFGGYEYFKKAFFLSKILKYRSLIPVGLFPEKWQNKFNETVKYGIGSYGILSRKVFEWEEIKSFFEKNSLKLPDIHPVTFIQNQILEQYPNYVTLTDLQKLSYQELFYYVSSHHAMRNERPSMLCSVETRFPFLDHVFVESFFNQKQLFKNLIFTTKPEFKKMVKVYLHPTVLKMKKKGFSVDNQLDKNKMKEFYLASLHKIFPNLA